jgi:hypothetical protein
MRRIAAAAAPPSACRAQANYAAITNRGGAAQYGGSGSSRSNRCFDSKLTSEKSLALKAVAPLHVVVAVPPAAPSPMPSAAAPPPLRRHGGAAASYSILARTAAADTHALSFLGLEASALWEGGAFSSCGCVPVSRPCTSTTSKFLCSRLDWCLLASLPGCLHCLVSGCLASEAC